MQNFQNSFGTFDVIFTMSGPTPTVITLDISHFISYIRLFPTECRQPVYLHSLQPADMCESLSQKQDHLCNLAFSVTSSVTAYCPVLPRCGNFHIFYLRLKREGDKGRFPHNTTQYSLCSELQSSSRGFTACLT